MQDSAVCSFSHIICCLNQPKLCYIKKTYSVHKIVYKEYGIVGNAILFYIKINTKNKGNKIPEAQT